MKFRLTDEAGRFAAYARASVLTALYAAGLILICNAASEWIVGMLQGAPDASQASEDLHSMRMGFVSLNVPVYWVTALWFARTRSFAPVGRYIVPILIALLLALPVVLILAYPLAWVVFILKSAGRPEGWLVGYLVGYLPSMIPGILGAQLLRFPRPASSMAGPDSVLRTV